MKNILLFTILLFCVNLNAQQIINIPDNNFKSYLLGNSAINTNGNSEIEFSEATTYTGTLDMNNLQISDLTGIEYFIEATGVDASQNWINTIPDLGLLSKLVNLNLNQNYLTSVTLGNHPHLRVLNVGSNSNLTGALDLTGCTALTQFLSWGASPAGLDLSMSPQLDTLVLDHHTAVGNLDLSNNGQLSYFTTNYATNISNLTLGSHPDLELLEINNVPNVDVSGCPMLKVLEVWGTTAPTTISDLSNNPLLEIIYLGGISNGTNVNLINHVELCTLQGSDVDMSHIDFSLLPALKQIGLSAANMGTTIDLMNNSLLQELIIINDNLTSIDLSGCPLLTALRLDYNNLTTIDVSANPLLLSFQADGNNLTELNLANQSGLQYLLASDNNLSCLVLPASIPSLSYIQLNNNQLTRLDFSTTSAPEISVVNNELTYLDVANGYSNSPWFVFDATGNPDACINTDDIAYSIFNQADNKDASATYSSSCVDPGACTIITCPIPTNQMVEVTTPTTALFTWDAVPNATFYQVKYRLKGTTAWSTIGTSNLQRVVPNLTAKKYYQYKVRAECAAGDWSDFSPIELFYTSTCDVPTGVASIYLDNTRMRIRWDNDPNEIKAKVRYREVGTSTWYTQNSTPGNNYIYINNLTPNATYHYRVRSNCSGNDWSAYTGLYTHDLSSSLRLEQENNALAVTRIYPNPTRDILNIEFETSDTDDVNIIITDNLGRTVHHLSNTYDENIQTESIDISQFPNGYYFITIQSGERIETQKFMKIE